MELAEIDIVATSLSKSPPFVRPTSEGRPPRSPMAEAQAWAELRCWSEGGLIGGRAGDRSRPRGG